MTNVTHPAHHVICDLNPMDYARSGAGATPDMTADVQNMQPASHITTTQLGPQNVCFRNR